jgi:large subunit ribosomal protein L13
LQIVGRLAAQLSILLQGKDKPIFAPHKDQGDLCIIVNAEKAVFTGNKWEGKVYKWHTGEAD